MRCPAQKRQCRLNTPALSCNRLPVALQLRVACRTPHWHWGLSEPYLHWNRCGFDLLLPTSTLLIDWHVTEFTPVLSWNPAAVCTTTGPCVVCADRPLTGAAWYILCPDMSVVIAWELSLTHFCTVRPPQTLCYGFAAGQPFNGSFLLKHCMQYLYRHCSNYRSPYRLFYVVRER